MFVQGDAEQPTEMTTSVPYVSRLVHDVSGGARIGDGRTGRDERGSLMHKVGASVVVLVLVAGAAAYLGLIPSLTSPASAPRTEVVGPPASGPGLTLKAPRAAAKVLTDAKGPAATSAGIEALIADAVSDRSQLGRHVGVAVARLGDRAVAWQHGDPDLVTPASTLKLLTTTAALEELGPEHTFSTTVVRGRNARTLVLVGGGDPLLTDQVPARAAGSVSTYPRPASLQQLARKTAAQLRADGVAKVRLGYDVSLFTGPDVNPAWEATYIPESIVSPISPLWVDEGRQVAGYVQRVPDPAQEAADRFVVLLGDRGIQVVGPAVRTRASAQAPELAAVDSPTLAQIVQHVIELSDNEGAEVLLRHVALAQDRPGSFVAGVSAMKVTLDRLGIDLSRASLDDGSGLARTNLLPVAALVQVLQTAASDTHPELRTVVATLPVAGFSGSLGYRFVLDAPTGLGAVRAKTGTLSGVHGLAGLVHTADGGVLVFAAVADRVPVLKTLDARAQLDRIAALLASCGC